MIDALKALFLYEQRKKLSPSELARRTKARLISISCLALSFGMFITTFLRLLSGESFGSGNISAIVISFLFFGAYLFTSSTYKIGPGLVLTNVVGSIAIPIRIFQTGGLGAPATYSLIAYIVFAFATGGKRWGVAISVYGIAVIFGFAMFQDHLPPPEVLSLGKTFALTLTNLSYILVASVFLIRQKEIMGQELRDFERENSAFLVLRRLDHEIGNSLNICLGYLEIYKLRSEPKSLKKISAALENIQKVAGELAIIARRGDLVQFLKDNEKEIRILDALKRGEQGLPK